MLKDSVYAASAIETLQKEEGLDGVQIAMDLNVSPQLISNIKHGHRKLQKDIAKASLRTYDSPMYAMELLYEFSEGYTAPVLKGKAIEHHRLALEEFAIQQTREVIQILEEVSLLKPPSETSEEEKKGIREIIYELLDAETAIANLKAILASEYGISLKKCIEDRKPYWKSKGWI
ncbi:MAG: XRE family transcriptional regulator [Caldibacillus thermoamylovorans]